MLQIVSRGRWFVSVLGLSLIVLSEGQGLAACGEESPRSSSTGPFTVQLTADCTPAEREARAVDSSAILHAIAKGRAIELRGVVVRGDWSFDTLAVEHTQVPKGLTREQEAALKELSAGELRMVPGPISIRDSVVSGAIRHQSAQGTLQFEKSVDLRGTVFRNTVDLSRSVFQGGVDLSQATFLKEALFVQGQVAHGFTCKDTVFGPHTRFHRTVFRGPVTCSGARFDGLAEFLEVTFEQPATFEGARFGSGTGFSGSLFERHANFAEAIFSRDTFFTFARFDADVSFAGAQFLATADFSDAVFARPDDLMQARFEHKPLVARARRQTAEQPRGILESPAGQYGVTLFLLLMAALLVAYAWKLK